MRQSLLLFLFLMTCCASLFGQVGKLRGKVIDLATSQTLAYASVFINETTIGVQTRDDGTYVLRDIPYGDYTIVVSYVGYQTYQAKLSVKDTATHVLNIRLAAMQLDEVIVSATRDEEWEKQLVKFNKLFLGVSPKNEVIKIRNPYALTFNDKDGVFTASSSEVLDIDNYTLGYHISYEIKNFAVSPKAFNITGNALFEELKTTDSMVAARWNENRRKVYEGSLRHFLSTLIRGKTQNSGFELYTDIKENNTGHTNVFLQNLDRSITRLNPSSIRIDSTSSKGLYKLQFPKRLEIHYKNKFTSARIYRDVQHPVSSMEVTGGVLYVTREGVVVNYSQLVMAGDMSEIRIADFLPNNYKMDSQQTVIPPMRETKETARLSRLIEKPYLHTDKSVYYNNDHIFFKAYVNYSDRFYTDSLSHVLYVELVDIQKKKVISTRVLPLWDGWAEGTFTIPPSSAAGDYALRAYTRWQLNFSKNLIFHKPIKILQFDKVTSSEKKETVSVVTKGIQIVTDKERYSTRDKIEITVRAFDSTSQEIPANLSISVTDIKQVAAVENEKNILDDFPLHKADTTELPASLKYRPQIGIEVHGHFISKKGKHEEAIINAYEKKSSKAYSMRSERDGQILMEGLQFSDTSELVIQAKSVSDQKRGTVLLDSVSISPEIKTINPLSTSISDRSQTQSYGYWVPPTFKDARLLSEVTVKSTRIKEHITPIMHMANYSLSGDLLRSIKINNIPIALQGKIPGLRILTFYDGVELIEVVTLTQRATSFFPNGISGTGSVKSTSTSSSKKGEGSSSSSVTQKEKGPQPHEPLILIDGNQVNYQLGEGARALRQLQVDQIESIEVFTSNGYGAYGYLGNYGVINIKRRNPEEYILSNARMEVNAFKIAGYSTPVEFAFIDYSKQDDIRNEPDFRSTIYWNPTVANSIPAKPLTFFAADNPTTYRIIVEGVLNNGTPVRGEKLIEIREH